MNELMTLARALGEKLKESEQYKNFCETRDKCKENPTLKAKLDEFKVQKKVYDIESAKGDENDTQLLDAISARMETLYSEITSHPEMKAYNMAEENLNILLNAINMTITSYISPETLTCEKEYDDYEDGVEGGAECTHNCATCKGCH
ncbi:MAG: YlbF family regulator [Clostridia bacterium]|nr:YlbF family regulator [Clostridia bacterium]